MLRAIKVRLYPTKDQAELMDKHFGCCRYVYNWALEKKIAYYTDHKKGLGWVAISALLTKHKKEKEWLGEVSNIALQQAIIDLESAFSHFFRKNNKFPKFKSKRSCKNSYRIVSRIRVEGKTLTLPKLGKVKFKDRFKFQDHYDLRNATVSRSAGKYYASILYENGLIEPAPKPVSSETMIGIDLGLIHYATLSNSTKIDNPRNLAKSLDYLAKAQQNLSRRTKASKNYNKQRAKVARIYEKVNNRRKDFLHKLVNNLVENQDYGSFAIEDLSIKTLMQKGQTHMSRAIGDASWYTFRQILEYKAKEAGKQVVTMGRFDASSKTCTCGVVNQELGLGDRVWTCSACGTTHDRDTLAARNIVTFALTKLANGWGAANKKEST